MHNEVKFRKVFLNFLELNQVKFEVKENKVILNVKILDKKEFVKNEIANNVYFKFFVIKIKEGFKLNHRRNVNYIGDLNFASLFFVSIGAALLHANMYLSSVLIFIFSFLLFGYSWYLHELNFNGGNY